MTVNVEKAVICSKELANACDELQSLIEAMKVTLDSIGKVQSRLTSYNYVINFGLQEDLAKERQTND